MANEHSMENIIEVALQKLKEISGSDTIIGSPISLGEGVTAIPVSKVSFGFAGGGSDFGKPQNEKFGVGTGGGVTVTPIAFLVNGPEGVRLMELMNPKGSTVDNIIRTAPDIVDRVSSLFKKDRVQDE